MLLVTGKVMVTNYQNVGGSLKIIFLVAHFIAPLTPSNFFFIKFLKQTTNIDTGSVQNSNYETITINSDGVYQTMDGFGFALTGASAYHIYNLSTELEYFLL